MLILTRKIGETIMVGDDIKVTILGTKGGQIRAGIQAPKTTPVHRQEVYDPNSSRIRSHNTSIIQPSRAENMIHSKRTTKKRKILIVEDNQLTQAVINFRLKNLPFQVKTVSTGQEALQEISENYDLVLLDIGLPGINGIEICKRIRQKGLKDTVIIMITENGNRFEEEAMAAGANQFLIKPFSQTKIHQVLGQHLNGNK